MHLNMSLRDKRESDRERDPGLWVYSLALTPAVHGWDRGRV